VMRRFKDGAVEVLVATDVAARGLDISDVTHIYNFDIPQDPEGYVHRVGRTGRAGKTGVAVTFVTSREIHHLRLIENMIRGKIARKPIPTIKEAVEGQQRLTVDKLLLAMENGDTGNYKGLAESLLEENDAVALLTAALKVLTKESDQTPVTLTEERPLRVRQDKYKKPAPGRYAQSGGGKKGSARTGSHPSSRGKSRFGSRSF